MSEARDRGLDALLDLDGLILVVDPVGKHWVRFSVRRVPPTPDRPHGLSYSLTPHDERNVRLVGFDNAHAVRPSAGPGGKSLRRRDHRHRFRTIKPYEYKDAAQLLEDFWAEVDAVLKERGAIR